MSEQERAAELAHLARTIEIENRRIDRSSVRYELALRRIMGTECERLTTGIGSCIGQFDHNGSDYLSSVCPRCEAWAALYPAEAERRRKAAS